MPAGELPPGFEVGAMAEVPAFALHARAAVPLVDLISIGTNDLTQYTLAAERGNADVAALADPLDPAVLHLISEVANAATARARVAVCGEIAADPAAAALLIGLGVHELSMTPRAIPAVKDAIRSMSANKSETTRRPRAPPRFGRQRPSPPQRPSRLARPVGVGGQGKRCLSVSRY